VDIPRPARTLTLTAKLKDAANTETPQLSFQRKAVHDFHSRDSRQANRDDCDPSTSNGSNPPPSLTVGTELTDPNAPSLAGAVPRPSLQTKSNTSSFANNNNSDDDGIVDQPVPCMSLTCLRVTSFLSHVSVLFTAKKRRATATAQAKRRRVMSVTVDDSDIDMTDAEEVIRDKGMGSLNNGTREL
jgi:hypothetical protein